jgi:hypothetical protein
LLRFNARFESGNLHSAYVLGPDTYHVLMEYDPNSSRTCQWFYFQVTNVRSDAKYQFHISGFSKLGSVFCSGSKIFMYSRKAATRSNTSWFRAGDSYAYAVTKHGDGDRRASLQFQFRFSFDGDVVYLSYAIPYRYSDLLADIARWATRSPPLFTHRTLCQTAAGRDCPVLTISSRAAHTSKPAVFVTARIHPGESPSSIVLCGLVDFLLSSQPVARYLVDHFVFLIVPMMCIDGVVEGLYRCSLSGCDLNRVWNDPDPIVHPVVYHAKALMMETARSQKIEAYIDFHSHSCQHGTFAFGCPNDDKPHLINAEKVFPRILSMLSDIFSWPKCLFSYPDERKSASRIVVRTELDIVNAFTIETSFAGAAGGPLAGTLYDERLWREFGGKVGQALYHYFGRNVSLLKTIALDDIARGGDKEGDAPRQKWGKGRPDLDLAAYAQNRARVDAIVKKQAMLVRRAVVPRVVKIKVKT